MTDLILTRIKTSVVSPVLDSLSSPVRLLYDRLASSRGDHPNDASPTYSLVSLVSHDADEADTSLEQPDQVKLDVVRPTTYGREFQVYAGYMLPLFFQQAVQRYSAVMGPVAAMGKYGPVALAGASLGNTTLNILGIAPTLGITSALDTLSTQAHGGAKVGDVRDLNLLYSLRVFLVTTITMVVLIPLMCNFYPIFVILGVERDAAEAAATYMAYGALGMPGWYAYECLRKYAQAKGMMTGPALAGVVAGPVSYLVLHSDCFGSNTPPIALAVYFTVCFLGELAWAVVVLPKDPWHNLPPFSLVCQDLGIVFKLGAVGSISTCSDWFAWEYLSFASAWLGTQTLAANSVFLASATFLFCLPGSIMNAASTRVGNHLGENAPQNAKIAARAAMIIGVGVATTMAVVLSAVRENWVSIFTDDPEVFEMANRIMPFFSLIIAMDALQGTYGGIMRGAGLPEDIAKSMLVGHWLVGIPLSAVFAFTALRLGLFGLWAGFGVGLTIVCGKLTWQILTNDWELLARKAQSHIKHTADVVAQPTTTGDV